MSDKKVYTQKEMWFWAIITAFFAVLFFIIGAAVRAYIDSRYG